MGKPGRSCSICARPDVTAIDADRRSIARVAMAFAVPPASLHRHRKHAVAVATVVVEKRDLPPAQAPVEGIDARAIALKTLASLEEALSRAEPSQVAPLANAIARQTQFLARLAGEFELTESMIVRSRPFRDAMMRISAALKPFPDAQRALAASFAECL